MHEKHKPVCGACDLFGATGWKRRFRMEIGGGAKLFTIPEKINIKIRTNGNGWHFPSEVVKKSIIGARFPCVGSEGDLTV